MTCLLDTPVKKSQRASSMRHSYLTRKCKLENARDTSTHTVGTVLILIYTQILCTDAGKPLALYIGEDWSNYPSAVKVILRPTNKLANKQEIDQHRKLLGCSTSGKEQ